MWRGAVSQPGDADYFKLGRLDAGKLIRLVALREGSSSLYPRLFLANSSGQILYTASPLRMAPRGGVVAFIETIIEQSDDYYLVLAGDVVAPNQTTLSSGAYDLYYASFDTSEDPYEENDTQAQVDAASADAVNSPNLGRHWPGDGAEQSGYAGRRRGLVPLPTPAGRPPWRLCAHYLLQRHGQPEPGSAGCQRASHPAQPDHRQQRGGQPAGPRGRHLLRSGVGAAPGVYSARVPGIRITPCAFRPRLHSIACCRPPIPTDAAYNLSYELAGSSHSSAATLAMGSNVLIVSADSGPAGQAL